MRKTITAAAIVLAASQAQAQYYDPAGAAYMAGPPLQEDLQFTPTWRGNTQWGATLYLDVSDGSKVVLWQPNPQSPVFYKSSTGETGSMPATSVSLYNQGNLRMPRLPLIRPIVSRTASTMPEPAGDDRHGRSG